MINLTIHTITCNQISKFLPTIFGTMPNKSISQKVLNNSTRSSIFQHICPAEQTDTKQRVLWVVVGRLNYPKYALISLFIQSIILLHLANGYKFCNNILEYCGVCLWRRASTPLQGVNLSPPGNHIGSSPPNIQSVSLR